MSWLGLGEIENVVARPPRALRRELLIYQRPIRGYHDGTFPVKIQDAPSMSPSLPTVANWSPGPTVQRERF